MRGEEVNFDGAVIAFCDITEMTAALDMKNDFVANVSPEFRTPLTSIQGYLEMVLDELAELPRDVHKHLTIASRNVEQLSFLVADLLSTNSVTLTAARADVARLVADSMGSAAPAAPANNVVLSAQVQASLEAFIDARRVGQVLDILVSNAVKYSIDGETVTVRAWAQGPDLWCEVQDTGRGINGAEQAEAFTKSFRVQSVVNRSIPGIVLGLMISKTIVAQHGGTIDLRSDRRVGDRHYFRATGVYDLSHRSQRIQWQHCARVGRRCLSSRSSQERP